MLKLLACALGGLARPFTRPPGPAGNVRKSQDNDQHQPQIVGRRPKSAGSSGPPSPVRPSLRAGQSEQLHRRHKDLRWPGEALGPRPAEHGGTPQRHHPQKGAKFVNSQPLPLTVDSTVGPCKKYGFSGFLTRAQVGPGAPGRPPWAIRGPSRTQDKPKQNT